MTRNHVGTSDRKRVGTSDGAAEVSGLQGLWRLLVHDFGIFGVLVFGSRGDEPGTEDLMAVKTGSRTRRLRSKVRLRMNTSQQRQAVEYRGRK